MLILDFPPKRLVFANPTAILTTDDLDGVLAVIAEAEARAIAGEYVVGFVSYDASPAFDDAFRIPGRSALPLVYFEVFDRPTESAPGAGHTSPVPEWKASEDRTTYDRAVHTIREQIRNGDVYQVNHTLRLRADWRGDELALYERLRAAQRGRYSAFLDLGDYAVASVSPELFFERRGASIEARPMKGTARRGRWTDEDRAMRDHLVGSPKERAENLMIVDLLRNDVGRVARTGTVEVPELLTVERYPTVWQLTSTVRGVLRADASLAEIFRALFPCGSVTGAPKIAAMREIARLEPDPRSIYCGAIGLIRPGGDCVFNVAIRTAVVDRERGTIEYGVGGGITFDSSPAAEYDELLAKAVIFDRAPESFSLLETLRLEAGGYARLDAHLRRLRESADYFGFPDPGAASLTALQRHAGLHPGALRRVRLVVSRDGRAEVTSAPIDAAEVNPSMPITVALAREPVHSRDVFLFHKTTNRSAFERRRDGADDVILWNERDEITELTIGNLVVEIDGRRYTPPRDCGLLPGVFRAELLEKRIVEERVLRLDDLRRVTNAWRVSSLREWTPLALPLSVAPDR